MCGVRVCLDRARPSGPPLEPQYAPVTDDELVLAEVRCHERVHVTPADAPDGPWFVPEVHWVWRDDRARVEAGSLRGCLRRTSAQRYRAKLDACERFEDTLRMVVHPVLMAEGGACLHAAAAELEGRVYLFIGPSGAGKSTAVGLCPSARLFAIDRVGVFPARGAWWASPLPGGTPPAHANAPSTRRCLPLAGVLKVERDGSCRVIDERDPARAFGLLRAAAVAPRGDAHTECLLLDNLASLAQHVPVARAFTTLQQSLQEPLAAWARTHR